MYKEGELTYKLIGLARDVHRELGPGFPEKIYHQAMVVALEVGLLINFGNLSLQTKRLARYSNYKN